MNGPGRKSLSRRVFELETATPRKARGKKIVFAKDLAPGEAPQPYIDPWGKPSPVVIIRLDTRVVEIPEEFKGVIPGTYGLAEPSRPVREPGEEAWWDDLLSEEVN